MRRFLSDNSLSIACLVAFLGSLVGQAVAGQRAFNEEQLAHGSETFSLGRYIVSSEFGAAVMETVVFFGAWGTQSITGWNDFNSMQRDHDEPTVTWTGYLVRPDFWESTFQNWQSEFLAVGAMAVFTIYLRQRGSPESKPVGAPHDETATSG